MPPLLCFSPNIIDQTFPKTRTELELVQKALATLIQSAHNEECLILLTQVLSEFIKDLDHSFCWENMAAYPEVRIIYDVLVTIGLQQHGVYRVDLDQTEMMNVHPVPAGVEINDFSRKWSEELGRLLTLHSKHCEAGEYFIGVACTHAFAGEARGRYHNPDGLPSFPLVGPTDIGELGDLFYWDLPANIRGRNVACNDARNRIFLLGGTVRKAKGTSHSQVQFKGQRTWPLDQNVDPIPDRFLRQLEPITGHDLSVIKYVLIYGEWPSKKPRF